MPASRRNAMWWDAAAQADRRGDAFWLTPGSGWEPPIDVLETAAGLLVVVALPGVRPGDMEIIVGNGEISVGGTRRWPTDGPVRVHRVELPHGHFGRRVPLPQGRYQLAGREHVDGCLMLTLRRLD